MNDKLVKREITKFVIPIVLENILQLSANIISTAMIGRLSSIDIAAQGICMRISDLLWVLFRGISVGLMITASKAFANKDNNKIKDTIVQTLISGFIIVALFTVIIKAFSINIISFFSKNDEIISESSIYLDIMIHSLVFMLLTSVVSACFNAMGDTKTPLLFAGIMNLLNIVLGWGLIFGRLGMPELGLKGAALALIIAQCCSSLLGFFVLLRRLHIKQSVTILNHKKLINLNIIKEIYSIGIPAAMENIFWQISAVLLSKFILAHGADPFAAYQIGIQAEIITEMPAIAFGTASTVLIAKGRSDKSRLVNTYFKEISSLTIKYSIISSLILIFFSTQFMKFMTNNTTLVEIGKYYVLVMGFIQIPQNLSRVYNGTLRSSGYNKAPMIIAGLGIWGIRIPICALITYVFKANIIFVWIIIAFDQLFRFIVSFIWVNKNREKIFYY